MKKLFTIFLLMTVIIVSGQITPVNDTITGTLNPNDTTFKTHLWETVTFRADAIIFNYNTQWERRYYFDSDTLNVGGVSSGKQSINRYDTLTYNGNQYLINTFVFQYIMTSNAITRLDILFGELMRRNPY